ncbi:MAG TPA: hypothetical protein PKD00_00830 [Burkholderiales bacterium]|nr:hypothetical protein [Burkholderiales bacterium]
MPKHYFTFGNGQYTITGLHMKHFYVTVEADDAMTAREIFCSEFAEPVMGERFLWANQYTEETFEPHYYPSGEFKTLFQTKKETKKYVFRIKQRVVKPYIGTIVVKGEDEEDAKKRLKKMSQQKIEKEGFEWEEDEHESEVPLETDIIELLGEEDVAG